MFMRVSPWGVVKWAPMMMWLRGPDEETHQFTASRTGYQWGWCSLSTRSRWKSSIRLALAIVQMQSAAPRGRRASKAMIEGSS